MQQDRIPPGTKHIQRADHSAQHAVFITDMFFFQAAYAIPDLMPANDLFKIFLPGRKIPERRVRHPFCDGLLDRRNHREIHIRHPHGDLIKARSQLCLRKICGSRIRSVRRSRYIHCDRILSPPVQDTGKIILQNNPSFLSVTVMAAVTSAAAMGAAAAAVPAAADLSFVMNLVINDIPYRKSHSAKYNQCRDYCCHVPIPPVSC